jgi:hypothetical protein
MAQRIIKLTESQLRDIVAKVISEQTINEDSYGSLEQNDTQSMDAKTFNNASSNSDVARTLNIAKVLAGNKNGVIQGTGMNGIDGMKWIDYATKYQVTPDDIKKAQEVAKQQQSAMNTQNQRYVNIAKTISQVDPTTLKIKSTNPKLNGMSWVDYMKTFKVTQDDVTKAQAYVATLSKIDPKVNASAAAVKKASTPNPKVIELQKQLKAAGYDLGTTGPNKDGIDGIMGTKTKTAQQQLMAKGQAGVDKLRQNGQQFMNKLNQTTQSLSQVTPQQQATTNALTNGQPLPK